MSYASVPADPPYRMDYLSPPMNVPPTDPPDEETVRFQLSFTEGELRKYRDMVARLEKSRDRLLGELVDLLAKGGP